MVAEIKRSKIKQESINRIASHRIAELRPCQSHHKTRSMVAFHQLEVAAFSESVVDLH